MFRGAETRPAIRGFARAPPRSGRRRERVDDRQRADLAGGLHVFAVARAAAGFERGGGDQRVVERNPSAPLHRDMGELVENLHADDVAVGEDLRAAALFDVEKGVDE